MVAPGRLREAFPDLAHAELAVSAAVFHQRFSTNTMPHWRLAQPFRLLAHNGEINTIKANRNWATARAGKYKSPLVELSDLGSLVSLTGSDSQSLDNMLEVLVAGGLDVLLAMRVLMPPAWASREDLDEDLEAFYEYYALHSEPWDGPAGIVLCDAPPRGVHARPQRPAPGALGAVGRQPLIVASEAGLWDMPPERIVAKGRLGPGEMIAVDLVEHELLDTAAIDAINRSRAPFKRWLREKLTYLESHLIDPGTRGRAVQSRNARALPEAVRAHARGARRRAEDARRGRGRGDRFDGRRHADRGDDAGSPGRSTNTSARRSRRSRIRRSTRCASVS